MVCSIIILEALWGGSVVLNGILQSPRAGIGL